MMSLYAYRKVIAVVCFLIASFFAGCACDVQPPASQAIQLATDQPNNRLYFRVEQRERTILKSFLLYNDGPVSVLLKAVSLKGDDDGVFAMKGLPALPHLLKPGQQHGIKVTVELTSDNTANDIAKLVFEAEPLEVSSSTRKEPFAVELQKEVKRGQLKIDCPDGLDFGQIAFGKKKTKGCEIRNVGDGDVNISALVYNPSQGSRKAFQTRDITFPILLKPEQTQTIYFVYGPTNAESLSHEGRWVIESDLLIGPAQEKPFIAVRGRLLSDPNAPSCLVASTEALVFGGVRARCESTQKSVKVTNQGGVGCHSVRITSAKIQGAEDAFRIVSMPNRALSPNESLEIIVGFAPIQWGREIGSLVLESSQGANGIVTVALSGRGEPGGDVVKDDFAQLNRPKTDIMWIVDSSPSMKEEQVSMPQNFQSFINWAVRLNVDYQIMVIDTDVSGKHHPAGCAYGGTKIITPNTPNPTGTFMRNVKVGTRGSSKEQGLEAARLALSSKTLQTAACNKGFPRIANPGKYTDDDASISLIFVSDEDDQSPDPIEDYLTFFRSLVGPRGLSNLRISSITGNEKGCVVDGVGNATPAPRYFQVSKVFRGVQNSICDRAWGSILMNLGTLTYGYRTQFYLSRLPDVPTLSVKVNGQPIKLDLQDGWHYDPTSNSVNFSKSAIPPPGSNIEVVYRAACE